MNLGTAAGPTFLYLENGTAHDIFQHPSCRYNPSLLENAIQTLIGAQYCQTIHNFAVKKHRVDDSIKTLLNICLGKPDDPKEKLLQQLLCKLPRKDLFTAFYAGPRFLKKGILPLKEKSLAGISRTLQAYLDDVTPEVDPHLLKKVEALLEGEAKSRFDLHGKLGPPNLNDPIQYKVLKYSDTEVIQRRPPKRARITKPGINPKFITASIPNISRPTADLSAYTMAEHPTTDSTK